MFLIYVKDNFPHGRDIASAASAADTLELILVEPVTKLLLQVGEEVHAVRRQELGLVTRCYGDQSISIRPSAHPPIRLRYFSRDLTHQLVRRHTDREGEPHLFTHRAGHLPRHIHRGAEEPFGAGHVAEGVAPAMGFDDRSVAGHHGMERARGAGVELRVGR